MKSTRYITISLAILLGIYFFKYCGYEKKSKIESVVIDLFLSLLKLKSEICDTTDSSSIATFVVSGSKAGILGNSGTGTWNIVIEGQVLLVPLDILPDICMTGLFINSVLTDAFCSKSRAELSISARFPIV